MHEEKLIPNKLRINCKEATQLVVMHELGQLLIKQRLALWMHLLICKFCRLFNSQSKAINIALKKNESEKNLSLSSEKKEELSHLINELQRKHV